MINDKKWSELYISKISAGKWECDTPYKKRVTISTEKSGNFVDFCHRESRIAVF